MVDRYGLHQMATRFLTVCSLLLLAGSALAQTTPAQPPQNAGLQRVRQVSTRNAEEYANIISKEVQYISKNYQFSEISEYALAGRGLLGLYRTASIIPPEELVRDTDHYLENRPGASLVEKLKLARQAAGDMPLIQGPLGIHASMQAIFQSLDVFSNYSKEDISVRQIYEHGAGIGLFLEDKPLGGSYFVRNVTINSQAHKHGIRPGEELLEVDGTVITPQTSTSALNAQITLGARRRQGISIKLRTLQGVLKVITVSTTQNAQLENSDFIAFAPGFERETLIQGYRPLEENEWDYWVDRQRRIALIRLGTILDMPNALQDIILQLREERLKGLILDLRDCPSGVPEYSADLAGLFLERNALITSMQYRNPVNDDSNRNSRKEYRSRNEDSRLQEIPLAVLIGPDTSGAAEMIAAALQDHERATIVGQRSRGKSTIQQTNRDQRNPYNIYYSYRLTVGVFKRPSGKNLHRMPGASASDDWGVRPDVEVVLPAMMNRQVRAWWFEQDTRPVDSLHPTKLDDLRNDPVLFAAIEALRSK